MAYDYNTGKELLPGQQQSTFNTQTGQKLGTNAYSSASIAAGKAPTGAISAESLTPTSPVYVPPPTTSSTATGISGSADASVDSFTALTNKINADVAAKQKASETSTKGLEDTMSKILGVQESRQSVEDSLHVDELGKLNNDAFTALQASKRAQENEVRTAIDAAGGTTAGAQQAVQAINRRYAFEQADLSIALDVSNRNYLAASQTADKKIAMQLEPLQTLLQFQTTFYERNKDALSKAEGNQLQLLIADNQRKYDEQKTAAETLSKTKLSVMQMAQENQAPASVINAISMAKTPEEALQAAGKYASNVDTSVVEVGGRKLLINNRTGQTVKDLGSSAAPIDTKTILAGLTPEQQSDPFLQKLLASSGGKSVTGTPLDRMEKARTVLSQVGALQANIQQSNTGPILGAFRGANPWDTNAQTIKAQLNAIIPNLARGIYGEVGVLTDNDIKNYKGTIGNLNSTEDLNDALLYITIDLVGRSIKNTLEVQAAGGRDVSGFVDIYTDMIATRDSLLSQLPGNVTTTKEDEDAFDSVVSSSSGGIGGFFSDIWKGLTGK